MLRWPLYRDPSEILNYHQVLFFLSVFLGSWPSNLMNLPSLNLIVVVWAKNYERSSFSQWVLSLTRSYERSSFSQWVCLVVQGGDLDQYIERMKKRGQSITEKQIMDWTVQLLMAVDYMHSRRVLHRDLKARWVCTTTPRYAVYTTLDYTNNGVKCNAQRAYLLFNGPFLHGLNLFGVALWCCHTGRKIGRCGSIIRRSSLLQLMVCRLGLNSRKLPRWLIHWAIRDGKMRTVYQNGFL